MLTHIITRLALGLVAVHTLSGALLLLGRGLAGQIAFTSQRDSNAEIYLFDLDHLRLSNLTDSANEDYDPVWSPDGSRFAFVTVRSGNMEIRLWEMAIGEAHNLTDNFANDITPVWSPDSRQIVFISYRNGDAELYAIHADCPPDTCEADARRLTLAATLDVLPAWSPDNRRIAFVSDRDGDLDIYLLDSECSTFPAGCANNARNLTRNTTHDASPAWSPDGRRLAFESLRDGNQEIYMMRAAGGEVQRLTDHPSPDRNPIWSPDGQHIAFLSQRDKLTGIYVMDADGTNVRPLTSTLALGRGYAWSPDSQQLVFTAVRDGNVDVYLVDIARQLIARLTRDAAPDERAGLEANAMRALLTATIAALHVLLVGMSVVAGYALPSGGEFAFVSDRGGNRDIYVADVTRNLTRNLTNSEVVEFSPVWSPDGRQIAFAASPAWGYDANLYVMDANGQHVHPLTEFEGNEVIPEWSPDGKEIAFTWNGDTGVSLLYVIDVDSGNLREIGDTPDGGEVLSHSWSPDGRYAAYSVMNAGWSTFIVTADGDFVRRLPIPNTLTQYDIDWSPNGQRLIFSSDFGGEYSGYTADINLADMDTGSRRALTDGTSYNGYSAWTPDGVSIIFTSWRDGNPEIYLMDADGSNPRRLTNHPATDVTPSWRP